MTEIKDLSIAEATVRVVAAFAGRESATVEQIVALARELPAVLAQTAGSSRNVARMTPADVDATSTPAVAIADSVTNDSVICLCCGRSFTMLKRHLRAEHGLSESEYRAKFDLDDDHPLVAPNYSMRKADYAKKAGLGRYAREETPQPETRSPI